MNWETITSDLGHKVYALLNDGRRLLTLGMQSSSNFVKLESEGEKRAFTIRYEGFLKNKMVMRNEYGVRIGHVSTENKENLIAFNDQRLYYTITNDKEPRVILYKESADKPFAVCALQVGNDKSVLPSVKPSATHQSLLLALCWYLFSPVAQSNAVPQFA